jgi:hypothetical protein
VAQQNQQPNAALTPHQPTSQLVSSHWQSGLTHGERRVLDEYRTQAAVIDAQAAKTIYAERVYSQVATYTHDIGVRTIQHIEATQAQTQSPAVRAFCEREKQIYGYQALEIVSSSGEALHREVSRSLYPERRRRLFGG